jgi:hypothetical protein
VQKQCKYSPNTANKYTKRVVWALLRCLCSLTGRSAYLPLLPGKVPDPPRQVLQPRVALLRAPHRRRLDLKKQQKTVNQKHSRTPQRQNDQLEAAADNRRLGTIGRRQKQKSSNGSKAYADPGLVQVSLVEAGDNLLDEVACGAEPAALPQHERRLVPLLPGRARRGGGGRGDFFRRTARVEDGLQVAVDPVIPRHVLRPPRTTPLSRRAPLSLSLSLADERLEGGEMGWD